MFLEGLSRLEGTVDDEVVKLAPVYFLKKLLDESILSRSTPNHCIVLIAQKEPNRHDSEVSSEYW